MAYVDISGSNNPNWQGGKTIKHCLDCGKRVSRNNKGGRCKSCAKMGSLNSFSGKKHTDETRIKMVKSNALRDKSTYKGKAIPFDVLSKAMKKRWKEASDEEKERLIEPFIKAGCKKSNNTNIEKIVNDILVENKIDEYKRNVQIENDSVVEKLIERYNK